MKVKVEDWTNRSVTEDKYPCLKVSKESKCGLKGDFYVLFTRKNRGTILSVMNNEDGILYLGEDCSFNENDFEPFYGKIIFENFIGE